MDVEAVEAGSEPRDFSVDLDFLSFDLGELDKSRDSGASVLSQDAYGVVGVSDHDKDFNLRI